jgi:hypothetical protein
VYSQQSATGKEKSDFLKETDSGLLVFRTDWAQNSTGESDAQVLVHKLFWPSLPRTGHAEEPGKHCFHWPLIGDQKH